MKDVEIFFLLRAHIAYLLSPSISENFIMHSNEVLKTPRFISISISCVILQNAMSAFSIKEQFLRSDFNSLSLSWSHRVVCREFFVSFYAISRLYLAQLTTQLISNEQAGQRRHKHEVSFESSQSPAKNVNYTNYCQLGGVHMSRLRQFFKTRVASRTESNGSGWRIWETKNRRKRLQFRVINIQK